MRLTAPLTRWIVAAGLVLGSQPLYAQTGTVLAQFIPGGPTGNGRGMAFDGTDLYYTIVGDARIFKVDTFGLFLGSITVGAGVESLGGPLAWDGSALWTLDYGSNSFTLYRVNPVNGAILSSCDIATQNPAHPAVTSNPNIGHFPDGLDWTGNSLWVSSEIIPTPNWAVEVDTNCNIISAFTIPVNNGFGGSGIAFDGLDLWHSNAHFVQFQTDVTGAPTGLSFANNIQLEDLACDGVTFAPKAALWSNQAAGGNNLITAYEIPQCERNTPPEASCLESVNPSGKKTPPAGSTTLPGSKGGQNEDGFYELGSVDAEDGTAPLFMTNASGSATFGPFPSGSVVKITEDREETPTSKPMGGPGSAVAAHIILDSDASVFAVDSFGAVSPVVSCLVPQPPK